jgi:hypothetical protein
MIKHLGSNPTDIKNQGSAYIKCEKTVDLETFCAKFQVLILKEKDLNLPKKSSYK